MRLGRGRRRGGRGGRAAARAAGIELVGEDGDDGDDGSGSSRSTGNRNQAKPSGGFKNPFAAIADAVSRGREQALGSSGAVTVMGAGGRPERLDTITIRVNI